MKKKNIFNCVISIYEILGGVAGLVITAFIIFSSLVPFLLESNDILVKVILVIISIIIIFMYVLSIIGGYLLLKKSKYGVRLSIFVQLIQIPNFILSGFSYLFISGMGLTLFVGALAISSIKFSYIFYGLSSWNIKYNSNEPALFIGVNIIALIISLYLFKGRYIKSKKNNNNMFKKIILKIKSIKK